MSWRFAKSRWLFEYLPIEFLEKIRVQLADSRVGVLLADDEA